jgi:ribonuclease Z
MLEVVFLGTSGSVPTTERGMPAIAIKYGGDLMLWDCGEGTQRQLMRYNVGYGSISQICITHPHLDHYLGIFGLLETKRLSSPCPKKTDVYSYNLFDSEQEHNINNERYTFASFKKVRKGTLHKGNGYTISAFPVKHCRGSYGLVFQEDDMRKFHEKKAHSLGLKGRMFREIQENGEITVGGKKVELDEVTWLRPGRKIVYTGDSAPCESTIEAAKGADLLIHEGTFDSSMEAEARERNHSTVADAAWVARDAGVKRLVITHLSPRYSDTAPLKKEARVIFNNTEIAYDGLNINVSFED